MKKILLALGILIFALLAGCSAYRGEWACSYVQTGSGGQISAGDLAAADSGMSFRLRAGGGGTFTAGGDTQSIRWRQSDDGTSLILGVDGEDEVFSIAGDTLVWQMSDDETVTFVRADSDAYQAALADVSPLETAS